MIKPCREALRKLPIFNWYSVSFLRWTKQSVILFVCAYLKEAAYLNGRGSEEGVPSQGWKHSQNYVGHASKIKLMGKLTIPPGNIWVWSTQSTRAWFIDPYILVQSYNDLWCVRFKTSSPIVDRVQLYWVEIFELSAGVVQHSYWSESIPCYSKGHYMDVQIYRV